MRHFLARILVIILVVATCGGIAYIYLNYDSIERWSYLRSYTPSSQIAQLATDAAMSSKGREIFYFADPELKNKSEFNTFCEFPDRSLVLGCFTGADRRIYILDVTEKQLEGVEIVTAAHEMLHAAYVDLPNDEKQRVDTLLRDQLKRVEEDRILELYAEYNKTSPEEAINEMHSILPTEVANLSSELEDYYSQYFTDRSLVISVHKEYRSVFLSLQQKVSKLQAQLKEIGANIDSYKAKLDQLEPTIEQQLSLVNDYAESGDADNYYSALAQYRQLISDYNQTVRLLNSSVEQYNALVKEVNATALRQNNLVNSLDSNYAEKSRDQ